MFPDLTSPVGRLHHVGHLVRDIEVATTRFRDVLGYRVESDVIHDPVQTAYVRFLRKPGADHWLELVSPAGDGGKLARALESGVTLHHYCHETDDIDAALAHARDNGFAVIAAPVPAVAFPGRRIAWVMDRSRLLVEFVESGEGPLSLSSLKNV